MAATLTETTFAARVAALVPATQYGPDFRRAVRAELSSARFCWNKGDREDALHFLELAEEAARRDPQ